MQDDICYAIPDIQGVGLVLFDDLGRIFIVYEGVSKPQYDKEIGDPSIPWETRERLSDGTMESFDRALQRVLDEEVGLGVVLSELKILLQFTTSFRVAQTIFCARYDGASRLGGQAIETGELVGWEWVCPCDLANRRVRGGMREILSAVEQHIPFLIRESHT